MTFDDKPLAEALPRPQQVRERLGEVLREADLLRGLLRLSQKAEHYRRDSAPADGQRGGTHGG